MKFTIVIFLLCFILMGEGLAAPQTFMTFPLPKERCTQVNGKVYLSKTFSVSNHWDLPVKYGTDIYASGDGIVVETGVNWRAGAYLIVQYDNGVEITYCHLRNKNPTLYLKGDKVKDGEIIGYTGLLGINSTGPHLHLEARQNGVAINPRLIFGGQYAI
jgi:murein DD-endopeptidase MepM/ murein hydrolase activator NlpD